MLIQLLKTRPSMTYISKFAIVGLVAFSACLSPSEVNIIVHTNVPIDVSNQYTQTPIQITPRSTLLVHVGKAGGSTLRKALKVSCSTRQLEDPEHNKTITSRTCTANPDGKDVPLIGRQVEDIFHLWGENDTLISMVSTYLVTLRHPVHRIVSSYRYSHPQNCKVGKKPAAGGCGLIRRRNNGQAESSVSKLFFRCFPAAAMEDFAQALGSPWVTNNSANLTEAEQWACRKLGHYFVRGGNNGNAMPHMQFNYRYYFNRTVDAYPEKEVLGVRSESEWEDLVGADLFVGGAGLFKGARTNVSHGSEEYLSSPLSIEAYYKLCCVLVDEIEAYAAVLKRVANFSPESKQQSLDALYESCGISTVAKPNTMSWHEWKSSCQKKVEDDEAELHLQLLGRNNPR